MKKNKATRKLKVSRETLIRLDEVLQSIAGGCNDNSDCPECPGPIGPSCVRLSCFEKDDALFH